MKSIPLDKFRERIIFYLEGMEALAIESEGKILGFYYPKNYGQEEELKQAVNRLENVLEQVLVKNGMTEDELADLLDMTKPFPD